LVYEYREEMRDIRQPIDRHALPQCRRCVVPRPRRRRSLRTTRNKKPIPTPHVDQVSSPHESSRFSEEASVKRPSRRTLFEALYRAHYLRIHANMPYALERDRNDDYVQSGAQFAWEIWQAAYAHAIELAAQVCENRQTQHFHQDHKAVCRICARDIRALRPDADQDVQK
jgi:hypothetical protein